MPVSAGVTLDYADVALSYVRRVIRRRYGRLRTCGDVLARLCFTRENTEPYCVSPSGWDQGSKVGKIEMPTDD